MTRHLKTLVISILYLIPNFLFALLWVTGLTLTAEECQPECENG